MIGWGKNDLVCLPRQAKRALRLFPDAQLHWFSHSGHFPQLDVPQETIRLILEVTGGTYVPKSEDSPVGHAQNKRLSPLVLTSVAIVVGMGLLFAFGIARK